MSTQWANEDESGGGRCENADDGKECKCGQSCEIVHMVRTHQISVEGMDVQVISV